MIRFAKIVVYFFGDRNDDRCEGQGFQMPSETSDQVGRDCIITLQCLGRIIRVFGARNKGDRVNGITLPPQDDFLAGIKSETRVWL